MYKCEIMDKETGCSYIKEGSTLHECVSEFQKFFMNKHEYYFMWIEKSGKFITNKEAHELWKKEEKRAMESIRELLSNIKNKGEK